MDESINFVEAKIDFSNPSTQLQTIAMYETSMSAIPEAVDSSSKDELPECAKERFWLSEFNAWTVERKSCGRAGEDDDYDYEGDDGDKKKTADSPRSGKDPAAGRRCGRNVIYSPEGTPCSGSWVENSMGMRLRSEHPSVGICLTTNLMDRDDLSVLAAVGSYDPSVVSPEDEFSSWCPVSAGWGSVNAKEEEGGGGWSEEKLDFCVGEWGKTKGENWVGFANMEDSAESVTKEL